ncbi:hypothetical protein GCM10023310_69730 [Paenibacillus vulneris]|uniref:DUF6794 domain-containing protein n=1 Tax=Paenibacillus vulneris TaxID=1133364 RepID=A0ABW3UIK1_9BACL
MRLRIDSLGGLIDYIIQNELTEKDKEFIVSIKESELIKLHFGLALYIRNNFELTDITKVPNLLKQYYDYKGIEKNSIGELFLHVDDISYDISIIIWERLRQLKA